MTKLVVITTYRSSGPNYHGKDHATLRHGGLWQRMGSHRPCWGLYLYGADGRFWNIDIAFPWGPYSERLPRIPGKRLRWPWKRD